MNLGKLANESEWRVRKFFLWLCPVILVLLIYRLVHGLNGYQDAETLIQASKSISQRENPYNNEFFLNGYILAIPASLYNAVMPVVTGARLYVIINIVLISVLVWDIFRKRALHKILLTVILVLASSPTRAMAASVQHTGLILGCSYFAFRIACSRASHTKPQKLFKYVSVSSLLLIPMELKPQLMLPLVAVFIFHGELRRYLISTSLLAASLHLIMSLYLRMPLDKLWLERLLSRSSETTAGDSRENSPWTLMGDIFEYPQVWLGLSFACFIALILALVQISMKRLPTVTHFLMAFTIPLVLAYIHPYDLILSVVVVASAFVSDTKPRGATFSLALFLFPTLGLDLSSLSFSLGLLLLCWYISVARFTHWLEDGLELVFSLLVYLAINLFTQDLGLRVNIHMSVLILGSIIFTWVRLVSPALRKKQSNSFGID